MRIDIDYQEALDWGHCEDIIQASDRLSRITNFLNKIVAIRQQAKKEILEACATYTGEQMHKLSFDNKLVRLSELEGSSTLANLWADADSAYRQLRLKQEAILEDLMGLKKIADITPR